MSLSPDFCVRLPWLHPASGPAPIPRALRLAVGAALTVAEGEWLPADYPFTQAEASFFLQELQRLDVADLESLRHIPGTENIKNRLSEQAELQALARFTGADSHLSPWDMLRRHAHKMLIWLWHMEDQVADLAALESRCQAAETALGHNFSEDNFAVLPEARSVARVEMPDLWRVCAANAILFIPPETPILVEGAMREDLLERFAFESAPLWGEAVVGLMASPEQILGQAPPLTLQQTDQRLSIYNGERLWLALR